MRLAGLDKGRTTVEGLLIILLLSVGAWCIHAGERKREAWVREERERWTRKKEG